MKSKVYLFMGNSKEAGNCGGGGANTSKTGIGDELRVFRRTVEEVLKEKCEGVAVIPGGQVKMEKGKNLAVLEQQEKAGLDLNNKLWEGLKSQADETCGLFKFVPAEGLFGWGKGAGTEGQQYVDKAMAASLRWRASVENSRNTTVQELHPKLGAANNPKLFRNDGTSVLQMFPPIF